KGTRTAPGVPGQPEEDTGSGRRDPERRWYRSDRQLLRRQRRQPRGSAEILGRRSFHAERRVQERDHHAHAQGAVESGGGGGCLISREEGGSRKAHQSSVLTPSAKLQVPNYERR